MLRIEDTDLQRSEHRYESQLLDDLKWLGLNWDEGPDIGGPYSPYRQSDKLGIYHSYADRLIRDGKAYYCFCSEEELQRERAEAIAEQRYQVYLGKCRGIDPEEAKRRVIKGETAAIRLKIPQHPIGFFDIVRGNVQFPNDVISDPIIIRSNGVPVYNYVVVVDDAEMQITHVIRGDDHISNTPRQVALYEALGFHVPIFAHLSTILGPDRERLSKRHGATSVAHFREIGILPEALINYLALLGWAPTGGEKEIFTVEALVREFSLERVTPSPAIFDNTKLNWFNRHYIKRSSPEKISAIAYPYFEKAHVVPLNPRAEIREWIGDISNLLAPYVDRLSELPERANIFFGYNAADALEKPENVAVLNEPSSSKVLQSFVERVSSVSELAPGSFKKITNELKDALGVTGRSLFHPIRILLIGAHSGPDFDRLVPLIEKGSMLGLPIHVKNIHERAGEFVSREISLLIWQLQSSPVETAHLDQRQLSAEHRANVWLERRGLVALNSLASRLVDRGNFMPAFTLQSNVKEICLHLLGGKDSLTWIAAQQFAELLAIKGEHEAARELQERVVEAFQTECQSRDDLLIGALHVYARLLSYAHNFEEASRVFERVLQMLSAGSAEDDLRVLFVNHDFADVLSRIGRLTEAKRIHEQVLQRKKAVLGVDHPETLRSIISVSRILKQLGDLVLAESMLRDALQRSRESLGCEHPITTESAWHLAELFILLFRSNIEMNLSWLFAREPVGLTPFQNGIRNDLARLTGKAID